MESELNVCDLHQADYMTLTSDSLKTKSFPENLFISQELQAHNQQCVDVLGIAEEIVKLSECRLTQVNDTFRNTTFIFEYVNTVLECFERKHHELSIFQKKFQKNAEAFIQKVIHFNKCINEKSQYLLEAEKSIESLKDVERKLTEKTEAALKELNYWDAAIEHHESVFRQRELEIADLQVIIDKLEIGLGNAEADYKLRMERSIADCERQEKEKLLAEEQEKLRVQEEERKKLEERRRTEEEERVRKEKEQALIEEEAARQKEVRQKEQEEEDQRIKAEEEKRRKEEEEQEELRLKRLKEEERKKLLEEEKVRKKEEEQRIKAEEEKRRKEEEEREELRLRRLKEEERKKLLEEEEVRKKEEEQRIKAEERLRKKRQEKEEKEELRLMRVKEEERKKLLQEEKVKKKEEERLQREAKVLAEKKRKQEQQEKRQKAAEQNRMKKEERKFREEQQKEKEHREGSLKKLLEDESREKNAKEQIDRQLKEDRLSTPLKALNSEESQKFMRKSPCTPKNRTPQKRIDRCRSITPSKIKRVNLDETLEEEDVFAF